MTEVLKLSIPVKIWILLTPAERYKAIFLIGLIFIGMLLETVSVGLVIPAIALITQSNFVEKYPVLQSMLAVFDNLDHETLVIAGMLSLVIIYIIKNSYLAFLAWQQARFAFRLQSHLSQRLFTLYLYQPYTFHLQRNSAKLIRNVMGEVAIFTSSAISPIMIIIAEIMVITGLSSLLLAVEPAGTLIVFFIFGLAGSLFYRMTRQRIAQWAKARQFHEGLRLQHLQQGLSGAKDMKLLGRETEFLDQYRLHNFQSAQMGQQQYVLQQLPRLWIELLAISGLAALVISMIVQGYTPEAVLPALGLFAAAAFRLMPSANRLLSSLQALRFSLPVLNNLHSELSLLSPTSITAGSGRMSFKTKFELLNVYYTYPGAATRALNDISLSVIKGESVGFIGTSGSGKSTLVDILLGLLTPDTGFILVDNRNIQENLRDWQDQIGYVPQTIYLTDDTLRRNVAFGLSEKRIDEKSVWDAIHAAQLADFVNSLPDGLDTIVGERGIRLSGGQRQRIGIARALYHNPTVLVLDEATSSLDINTERDVMESVRAMHGSKTILIVAHRLSTVESCDRLYRLEQGRIVEAGTPASMLPVYSL